ncbi:MAG: IS91 family transposase [Myxococcota bacterium]
MKRHRPEVADVVRSHGPAYLRAHGSSISSMHKRVLRDLAACRTAALGGHKSQWDRCGHEEIAYNSCRNRHCPKCQAAGQAAWLEARRQELLEVPYFHVVLTLPDRLGPLALQNKRLVYGLLFRAASETLQTIARDPKHLGAEIGFLAVLHTWGQALHHHPHVHCVVPGGGISLDGKRWVACKRSRKGKHFLLPVRVLSRLFRGKLLAYLRKAFDDGKLVLHGRLAQLSDPLAWRRFLDALAATDWVVYAKPPFGGPGQVLKYLARYTHRVAISNSRLVSIENGQVTFRWKDYRRGNEWRIMTLDARELLRRFLLHTLPKGFQRIRHYGFLANRVRQKKLALCCELLGSNASDVEVHEENRDVTVLPDLAPEEPSPRCPVCPEGRMRFVGRVKPQLDSTWIELIDTS